MDSTTNISLIRRRLLISVCLALVAFIVILLALLSRPIQPPRVITTYSTVTNSMNGPVAVFNLTNESDLVVHVYALEIGGVFIPCPSATIPQGKSAVLSATILPPTDPTGLTTNTVSLSSPIPVEFYMRRQDTRFEEAREMLDSVLKSVRVTIPGLNPDSSLNRFQIKSTIPAQR